MNNIKEYLSYNSITGVFTWIKSRNNSVKKGRICNYINKHGYSEIRFNYKLYKSHHLAWYYVYGYVPKEIDHINGIRSDNRICNLREVTRRENMQNKLRHRNGNLVGASFDKKKNKWRCRLRVKGKLKSFGLYNTQTEAHQKYLQVIKGL